MRKVAIVGSAQPSVFGTPYEDQSWEIWALGRERNRVTRYFEIHNQKDLAPDIRDYYLSLKEIPVYMLSDNDYFKNNELIDFPTRVDYPLEEVVKMMKRDWFTSSISYMVQLAILEEVDEIGLWGVDLCTGSEYGEQRPNAVWALGIAQGMGIKISDAKDCCLLRSGFKYGRDLNPKEDINGGITVEYLQHQIAVQIQRQEQLKEKGRKIERDFAMIEGQRLVYEQMIAHIKHHERGGHIPGSEV